MSRVTKKKHVAKEVLNDFDLPSGEQKIVKVVAGRGNNLHQVVESDDKTSYLASMPTKFRKSVWIKRGDFCVVEPIAEGNKVKGEIVRILYRDQIRHIKSEGAWPFKDVSKKCEGNGDNINKNTNQRQADIYDISDSDTSSTSEDGGD